MPTRQQSPHTDTTDEDTSDRLAQLESLLSHQLYSRPSSSTPALVRPDSDRDPDGPPPEQEDVAVSFRLFSTQKVPTRVTIREKSPTPPVHTRDPRTRDVEDEDPSVVRERRARIDQVAISGEHVLEQSKRLPVPHRPGYRLETRVCGPVARAPPSSTRERLNPFPQLAYLDSILPPNLDLLVSPRPVPVPPPPPPREPNERLVSKGPYTVGKGHPNGIKRRLPVVLSRGVRDTAVRLRVVPVLDEDKDSVSVTREKRRKQKLKEREKERKKRFKARVLSENHGDHLKSQGSAATTKVIGGDHHENDDKKKKKRKGRLSKERRARAQKRESRKQKV